MINSHHHFHETASYEDVKQQNFFQPYALVLNPVWSSNLSSFLTPGFAFHWNRLYIRL